jgi:hypothetical protein
MGEGKMSANKSEFLNIISDTLLFGGRKYISSLKDMYISKRLPSTKSINAILDEKYSKIRFTVSDQNFRDNSDRFMKARVDELYNSIKGRNELSNIEIESLLKKISNNVKYIHKMFDTGSFSVRDTDALLLGGKKSGEDGVIVDPIHQLRNILQEYDVHLSDEVLRDKIKGFPNADVAADSILKSMNRGEGVGRIINKLEEEYDIRENDLGNDIFILARYLSKNGYDGMDRLMDGSERRQDESYSKFRDRFIDSVKEFIGSIKRYDKESVSGQSSAPKKKVETISENESVIRNLKRKYDIDASDISEAFALDTAGVAMSYGVETLIDHIKKHGYGDVDKLMKESETPGNESYGAFKKRFVEKLKNFMVSLNTGSKRKKKASISIVKPAPSRIYKFKGGSEFLDYFFGADSIKPGENSGVVLGLLVKKLKSESDRELVKLRALYTNYVVYRYFYEHKQHDAIKRFKRIKDGYTIKDNKVMTNDGGILTTEIDGEYVIKGPNGELYAYVDQEGNPTKDVGSRVDVKVGGNGEYHINTDVYDFIKGKTGLSKKEVDEMSLLVNGNYNDRIGEIFSRISEKVIHSEEPGVGGSADRIDEGAVLNYINKWMGKVRNSGEIAGSGKLLNVSLIVGILNKMEREGVIEKEDGYYVTKNWKKLVNTMNSIGKKVKYTEKILNWGGEEYRFYFPLDYDYNKIFTSDLGNGKKLLDYISEPEDKFLILARWYRKNIAKVKETAIGILQRYLTDENIDTPIKIEEDGGEYIAVSSSDLEGDKVLESEVQKIIDDIMGVLSIGEKFIGDMVSIEGKEGKELERGMSNIKRTYGDLLKLMNFRDGSINDNVVEHIVSHAISSAHGWGDAGSIFPKGPYRDSDVISDMYDSTTDLLLSRRKNEWERNGGFVGLFRSIKEKMEDRISLYKRYPNKDEKLVEAIRGFESLRDRIVSELNKTGTKDGKLEREPSITIPGTDFTLNNYVKDYKKKYLQGKSVESPDSIAKRLFKYPGISNKDMSSYDYAEEVGTPQEGGDYGGVDGGGPAVDNESDRETARKAFIAASIESKIPFTTSEVDRLLDSNVEGKKFYQFFMNGCRKSMKLGHDIFMTAKYYAKEYLVTSNGNYFSNMHRTLVSIFSTHPFKRKPSKARKPSFVDDDEDESETIIKKASNYTIIDRVVNGYVRKHL